MTTTYPQTGWYWHVHHESLLEWCHNYQERRDYIQTTKPKHEIEIRLRLLRPVVGDLPFARQETATAYPKARAAHEKADTACQKAYAAWQESPAAYWKEPHDAYWKADAVRQKTGTALQKAALAYHQTYAAHREEIEAAHRIECPNCPWDGTTIFPAPRSNTRN